MENKQLTSTKIVFNPERDTQKAKKAADKLIDIVKQNNWAIRLGSGEHLKYEAWQTVGKYFNCTVATGESEIVKIGDVDGFKAKAWVTDNKTGIKVGEAEAYCMRDESNWKAKPTFQLASMAQTRAGSKALRQMFGFVVALAGYNPTPAEEMDGVKEAFPSEAPISQASFTTYPNNSTLATEKQWNFIDKLWEKSEKDPEELHSYLEEKFNIESYDQLSLAQASQVIAALTQKAGA